MGVDSVSPMGVEEDILSGWNGQLYPHRPQMGDFTRTIHFSHSTDIVVGVFEADKAVAFGFASALVPDDFGL